MNFEPSFLNSIQFNKNEDNIVGGYTYPTIKPKPKPLYERELMNYKDVDLNKNDNIEGGGSENTTLQVPVGLVINKHNDNMSMTNGTYTGVIDMQKINEFLDLNYRVLKQITRKNKKNHNLTVRKR